MIIMKVILILCENNINNNINDNENNNNNVMCVIIM